MKTRSLFLLLLAAVLAIAAPRPARAAEVSFDFFYDSLSPHGEWLEVGDYGYCWRPTGVDEDWAPYADGYWSYTDGGWTWVSYEDFGGIVYHYGRWAKLEDEGWCWVPEYEWAPAWVSWRSNDDYIGWAPLPPEARWERNRGFSVWVDTSYDIGPSSYSFCRSVDFGAPVLRPLLRHRRENVVIIQNTVNITNISFNTGADCVFNGGPDFVRVNRFVERPIPALKLVRNTNITVVNNTIINNNVRVRNVNAVQQGNQLVVVAPRVIRPEAERLTALVKPNVRRVVPQARVTRGWANVPEEQRQAIRTRQRQQTKDLTPETAPARAVRTADLEVLPAKADPNAVSPTAIRKDRPRPGADARERIANEKKPAVATPPATVAEESVDLREAARIAREKAQQKKAPAEAAAPATTEVPVPRERGKPGRAAVTKPFNPAADPPAAVQTPDADAATKRNAAQQAAQERQRASEAAAEQQATRQRQAEQQQQKKAATDRAAEEQQQRAIRQRQVEQQEAAQETARQRVRDQQQQQQQQQAQEAARQRNAEAAQQRQQMLQQQQEQNAARQRAAEAAGTRQRAAEQQEAARQRANEGAVQRQRMLEQQQQQQQQQAVRERPVRPREVEPQARQQAAERQQVQAARQQAIQQQQAQAAARQQNVERAQAQAATRQQVQPQRQAPAQRNVPSRGRKLTPEEAAALQGQ